MNKEFAFLTKDNERGQWRNLYLSRAMRPLLGLLASFVLSLSVHGQKPEVKLDAQGLIVVAAPTPTPKPVKPPKGFDVRYDKFRDETDISFMDYAGVLTFAAGFIHPGNTQTENVKEFYFYFSGSNCRGFCFNDPELIFLADGKRIVMPDKENVLSDSVIFSIDRTIFERLASSQLVEFKVGRFEGAWKDKNIGKLQAFLDLGTVKK